MYDGMMYIHMYELYGIVASMHLSIYFKYFNHSLEIIITRAV